MFWHLFITHFEKKASKAGTEKERAELLSNVKVLGIVGIMSVGVNIVIEGVSMYNDTTWMKSNRFGAIAMIIAGMLSVGTTIFTKALTAIILMTVYLLAAVIAIFIYSYRVYKKELAGQNN